MAKSIKKKGTVKKPIEDNETVKDFAQEVANEKPEVFGPVVDMDEAFKNWKSRQTFGGRSEEKLWDDFLKEMCNS